MPLAISKESERNLPINKGQKVFLCSLDQIFIN